MTLKEDLFQKHHRGQRDVMMDHLSKQFHADVKARPTEAANCGAIFDLELSAWAIRSMVILEIISEIYTMLSLCR
uniref:Uncharacterized protein n=1 Tax=Kalanchoe fedtschenkoi TaxID=63787 RepID=A0A7N0TC83_KALFE